MKATKPVMMAMMPRPMVVYRTAVWLLVVMASCGLTSARVNPVLKPAMTEMVPTTTPVATIAVSPVVGTASFAATGGMETQTLRAVTMATAWIAITVPTAV